MVVAVEGMASTLTAPEPRLNSPLKRAFGIPGARAERALHDYNSRLRASFLFNNESE